MDEREFIQRCVQEDKQAWDEFVDKYSRLIYNFIYKVFKIKGVNPSQDTVNDLFQEIFLSLIQDNFKKLRKFEGRNGASLASWLRVITINSCLDYLRKQKQVILSLEEDAEGKKPSLKEMLADSQILPDSALSVREKLEFLTQCIEALGIEDKYLLEMHIFREMTLEDLRQSLKISRSNIDMRKSRLIQRLRDCFKQKGFLLDS